MSLKAGTLEWIPDASHPQPGFGATVSSTGGVLTGTSEPEGVVTADQGTVFQLFDANGTYLGQRVKTGNGTNTGWQ